MMTRGYSLLTYCLRMRLGAVLIVGPDSGGGGPSARPAWKASSCHHRPPPRVTLPGAGREDLVDRGHGRLELLVRRVEVRGDADARAGAIIDYNVACEKLLRHL